MISVQTPAEQSGEESGPPSLAVSILAVAAAYAVLLTLAQVLLHLAPGTTLPFTTGAEWARFAGEMAGLGGFAGGVWYFARRLRPGLWRKWVDNTLRMTALIAMVRGEVFDGSLRWWVVLIGAGVTTGVLWSTIVHFLRRAVRARPNQPA